MEYLAYISVGFVGMQVVNVLLNLIFSQKLKDGSRLASEVTVSILIPARNEQENIGGLLDAFDSIGSSCIEILVYDDQSDDQTASIVRSHMEVNPKIRLLEAEKLPEGWLGKNRACHELAKAAQGEYLLFIDADVRLEKEMIADALRYMKDKQLALLSIFPHQQQITLGEKVTVPIMNYILLSLLPLVLVRVSPFSSHAAANGQFMLFNAEVYRRIRPHEIFKGSAVEDIAISRYYKKRRLRIACITGEKRVTCRMYEGYRQALNGFTKNVFMFFGNQPLVALLFWMLAVLGVVPVAYTFGSYLYLYLIAVVFVQAAISRIGGQSILLNVVLLPAQLFFLLQVIVNALLAKRRKGLLWKGRNIYPQ